MNNKFLLKDSYKTSLLPSDLYDRIINIKLYVTEEDSAGNKKITEYIIRSDYQFYSNARSLNKVLYKSALGGTDITVDAGVIRKIAYKPSISVQYTQVKTENKIGVDIYVDNFYAVASNGRIVRNLADLKGKVTSLSFALGYFSQFRKPVSYEDMFDFKSLGYGITTLNASVLYVTTEGVPPDVRTHFNCTIGDSIESPVIQAEEMFTYSTLMQEKHNVSDASTLFKHMITDRFVNETAMDADDKTIYENAKVVPENIMEMYGVKVYLSDEAAKKEIPKFKDADGNEVSAETRITVGTTVENTFHCINAITNWKLKYQKMLDGNYFVYTLKESGDVAALSKVAAKNIESWNNNINVNSELYDVTNGAVKVPAVYTYSVDIGVANLKCPFFNFINPEQLIEFNTAYGITGTALGITKSVASYLFNVLSVTLQFATVEDLNDMEISCVTVKE